MGLLQKTAKRRNSAKRKRTKDSGHGKGIAYAHLPNAPEDPDQRSNTPKCLGPGRRISVDPSAVNGRVIKTRYGRLVK
ncbi:hypothetical protein NPIL_65631 [Nephila pilipes]|uniref:Uncharacterized protein n=1 Tax=Nephila pilipes TaxID=299642 RepID=A0A8X6T725_NEPPI|nr:hypothetical protein NPIL_65631 [Nephila pilipes]